MILSDDRGLVIDKTAALLNQYENIGIMCSGGTDSTFALWWLAKCIDDLNLQDSHILLPIHALELVFKVDTRPHTIEIINFIRNSFPRVTILDPYIIKYRDSHEFMRDMAWSVRTRKRIYLDPVKNKLKEGLVDTIVTGSTSAPIFEKIDLGRITVERDYSVKKNSNVGLQVGVDKKFLAYQYKKFNLMNSLFPLTKSCVIPINKNGDPCKKCDWCKEKYWAFGCYDGGVK